MCFSFQKIFTIIVESNVVVCFISDFLSEILSLLNSHTFFHLLTFSRQYQNLLGSFNT